MSPAGPAAQMAFDVKACRRPTRQNAKTGSSTTHADLLACERAARHRGNAMTLMATALINFDKREE